MGVKRFKMGKAHDGGREAVENEAVRQNKQFKLPRVSNITVTESLHETSHQANEGTPIKSQASSPRFPEDLSSIKKRRSDAFGSLFQDCKLNLTTVFRDQELEEADKRSLSLNGNASELDAKDFTESSEFRAFEGISIILQTGEELESSMSLHRVNAYFD